MWELERYLTQRRKDIDRKYDFRFSRLTRGCLERSCTNVESPKKNCTGLPEDKVKAIRSCAKVLFEDAA